jgi:hypothetical protein
MTEFFPNEDVTLKAPLTLHHLTGGLGLLVDAKRLAWLLSPGSKSPIFFSVRPKARILSLFNEQPRLRILGRTVFQHADEMNDPVTSNFAIATPSANGSCLANNQDFHWGGLTTALNQMGRDTDALLARRVQAQIRICLARLERLSITYRTVLSIAVRKAAPKANISVTSDKYAHWLGSEYRSCLNELYSLRDAILATAFRLCFGRSDPFSMRKLKTIVLEAVDGARGLISATMFSPDGDLLIDQMSLYRSIAQHCLGATNPVIADIYKTAISDGPYGEIPYLVYPLYDDIEKMRGIEQGSSKGVIGPSNHDETIRFLSLPQHRDALEFCYDCFDKLLHLSSVIASEIAIEPKMITLTNDDIIEATVTDENGKITRVKRDEASGKLVEY